ncbi:MAG: hypothetical protein ACK5JR_00265 [Tropicimonas sp.]|uniref:hypothetical protein n=1 Tax=Tropicimonas sp. TaxID=2067044 RepID=UPI003A88D2F3
MFTKAIRAGVRALLVAVVILLPSMLVPGVGDDTTQIMVLIAMACALLTFVEYASVYPGLIEFCDAPPFNRIRYLALFATLYILSVLARGQAEPTEASALFEVIGARIGYMLDFPYSPVRLVLLSLPESASEADIAIIRAGAGLAYLIAVLALVLFYAILKLQNWPSRSGAFNVWVNLPTFDPTAGGDVVDRLRRDAVINVSLGFLLPFLIPAFGQAAASLFGNAVLSGSQTMIWMVSLWAFLPLSLLMRGVAMSRVAQMILEMRHRTGTRTGSGAAYST